MAFTRLFDGLQAAERTGMNNIEWFEKPIIKKASEMVFGDIIRCEFGDFDDIVRVVFEKCEIGGCLGTSAKITVRSLCEDSSNYIYELDPIDKVTFEVVGRVL